MTIDIVFFLIFRELFLFVLLFCYLAGKIVRILSWIYWKLINFVQ